MIDETDTSTLVSGTGIFTLCSVLFCAFIFFQHRLPALKVKSRDSSSVDIIAEDILKFWFEGDLCEKQKNLWFASGATREKLDIYIAQRFGNLLKRAELGELTALWSSKPDTCLALIIVLDQFSRHIYRNLSIRDQKVEHCDTIALSLTELMLEKGWQWQLNVAHHVFLLMPLRHAKPASRTQLVTVLKEIEKREKFEEKSGKAILERFRRATTRKLQEIEGLSIPGDDILERTPFVADETDLHKNKLVRGIDEFVRLHGVASDMTMAVSLSGGVDSMVLTKILHYLKKKHDWRIVAIHVDYANRTESGREADFVEHWCNNLGIVFRKRVVSEVTRGITERNEYETVAREARFEAYKDVIKEFNPCPAIMFGHHRGDLEENVISNVFRGCSLLKVAGMESESINAGVPIWRPLLPFNKSDIFEFAHRYGVPYFKDTTPLWSTRGKLRGTLVPTLKDMYGDGVLNHLNSMAAESQEIYKDLQHYLFNPFWASVKKFRMGICVNLMPYRGRGLYFWREAFMELLHSMGLAMLSDKALQMLMERLGNDPNCPNPKPAWWALRREFRSFCSENGVLYIFRPEAAPPEPYSVQAHGVEVLIGGGPIFIGPWEIQASESEANTNKIGIENNRQQPFLDIEGFITGEFSYQLAVTSLKLTTLSVLPPPILSNRNSQTAEETLRRQKEPKIPPCFKGMEIGLKSCIPIVSCTNDDHLVDEKRCIDNIKVTMITISYKFTG